MKRGAAQITVPNVPSIRILAKGDAPVLHSVEKRRPISTIILPKMGNKKHSLPASCHPTRQKMFSFYKVIESSPNSFPSKKDDIFVYIPEAFDTANFRYICVNSILDLQFKTDKRHTKIINSLIDLMNENRLTIEQQIHVMKYSMRAVVRDIPREPLQNQFAESNPIYTISNAEQLELIHTLFQKLLDATFYSFNHRFIKGLVQQLSTKVDFERNAIASEIQLIISKYESNRDDVIRCILSKIILFNNGVNGIPSSAISSMLQIYNYYLTSIIDKPTQENTFTFKTVFFPLYLHYSLPDFEKALKNISMFYISQDLSSAVWCLKYLIKHFPITTPRKQISFIQLISTILGYIDEPALIDAMTILLPILGNASNQKTLELQCQLFSQ